VTITVTNLDNATPLPASLSSHEKVTGVVGDEEAVVPIRDGRATASHDRPRRMSAVNANVVSHTFSLPSLRINVPISARSKTTFTIRIVKAGQYSWMCFDPCGVGATGFGEPMGLSGYMAGTVTATGA
jgi:hypothetical protein